MSELKRNADFRIGAPESPTAPPVAGIDESQPWRTADMRQALEHWDATAEPGFDPYNHVGTLISRSRVA